MKTIRSAQFVRPSTSVAVPIVVMGLLVAMSLPARADDAPTVPVSRPVSPPSAPGAGPVTPGPGTGGSGATVGDPWATTTPSTPSNPTVPSGATPGQTGQDVVGSGSTTPGTLLDPWLTTTPTTPAPTAPAPTTPGPTAPAKAPRKGAGTTTPPATGTTAPKSPKGSKAPSTPTTPAGPTSPPTTAPPTTAPPGSGSGQVLLPRAPDGNPISQAPTVSVTAPRIVDPATQPATKVAQDAGILTFPGFWSWADAQVLKRFPNSPVTPTGIGMVWFLWDFMEFSGINRGISDWFTGGTGEFNNQYASVYAAFNVPYPGTNASSSVATTAPKPTGGQLPPTPPGAVSLLLKQMLPALTGKVIPAPMVNGIDWVWSIMKLNDSSLARNGVLPTLEITSYGVPQLRYRSPGSVDVCYQMIGALGDVPYLPGPCLEAFTLASPDVLQILIDRMNAPLPVQVPTP